MQGEILNLLSELQRELGLTYLIITHNLPVVRHVSDRLAIMYMGRFVEQGRRQAIFAQPAHPYTHALHRRAAAARSRPRARSAAELRGEVPSLARRPSGCEFHPRCPFARDRCRTEAPALRASDADHRFTCHFPLGA